MDHPSWLISLDRAVARVAEHRQCSRTDAEWWLREQIDCDAIVFLTPDRHGGSRRRGMHPDEWGRESSALLRSGHTLSFGRYHDSLRGQKLWAFIHKDDLATLLAPTSPGAAQRLPPPKHAELVKFLQGYADGEKTEDECKRAAKEHFGRTIPDTNVWRPAWRAIPAEKKRSRGARKN